LVTIEGTVEEIIFSNEANGYTVCEIKCDKEVITVVGYMPFINVGETLRVSGKWSSTLTMASSSKWSCMKSCFRKRRRL